MVEPVDEPTMRRALLCARRSVELEPTPEGLTARGIAEYRLGEFAAAVETFDRARQAPPDELWRPIKETAVFGAMALWQSGDRTAARVTLATSDGTASELSDHAEHWLGVARAMITP